MSGTADSLAVIKEALSAAERCGEYYGFDFKREREGAEDALAALVERLEQAEAALRDAVWAADYLADQQAMPDDGYKPRLERARAALASIPKEEAKG